MEKKLHKLLKKENATLEDHFSRYGDVPESCALGLLAMADKDFPDPPQQNKKVILFSVYLSLLQLLHDKQFLLCVNFFYLSTLSHFKIYFE